MISIGKSKPTLEEIRKMLHEAPLVALRKQLTDKQILDTCAVCGYKFRNRQYGPVVTVLHFLAQAVGREGSFAATWQELWTPLIADFPEVASGHFNTSGLTHARQRLGRGVLQRPALDTCAKSGEIESPKWRGFRLLALDCSTVSMPRSAELFSHFGKHRAGTTTVRYPLGTFAALLAVGNSLVLDYQFGPYDPGEFAAHVVAYQLVRLLVCLAAEKHDKKPTEISFLNAARWIIHFSHRMAAAPTWSLRILYERLLDAIATCEIEVRPGRIEPRALTRAKRDFPDLRISRAEWRQKRAGGNA